MLLTAESWKLPLLDGGDLAPESWQQAVEAIPAAVDGTGISSVESCSGLSQVRWPLNNFELWNLNFDFFEFEFESESEYEQLDRTEPDLDLNSNLVNY